MTPSTDSNAVFCGWCVKERDSEQKSLEAYQGGNRTILMRNRDGKTEDRTEQAISQLKATIEELTQLIRKMDADPNH